MPRLDSSSIALLPPAIQRPRFGLQAVSAGILHFGPGAFHRVHQAWYAQRWLESDPRWGVTAVSLHSAGLRDALAPQDGLYTLAVLDRELSYEVIGSIRDVLVAPEAPRAVLERLAGRGTRLVTLTVTEKGYCLDGQGALDTGHPGIQRDLEHPSLPVTVIGYLVEGLRRRRESGAGPVPIVSCDNLADNGAKLSAAVACLAGERDPALAQWIRESVAFPRTLVDSITPATTDALRRQVEQATGLHDAWPVQREAFVQWVVEQHDAVDGPDWEGAGVIVTDDVSGFERAKLRLLNGAHSTLAYAGLLRGHETVLQAMQDPELARFVRAMMVEDIAPTVAPPRALDVPGYIEAVLERFRNPALRHELAQIAWDGSKKLPFRILGTVRDALAAGRPPGRLCVPLAAWMHFVSRRGRAGIEIVDPLAERLVAVAGHTTGDPARDVAGFLALGEVFPAELAATPAFRAGVQQAYEALCRGVLLT
jgi:fructuronate reductase